MENYFSSDLINTLQSGGGLAIGLAILFLAPLLLKELNHRLAVVAALMGLSVVVTYAVEGLIREFPEVPPLLRVSFFRCYGSPFSCRRDGILIVSIQPPRKLSSTFQQVEANEI